MFAEAGAVCRRQLLHPLCQTHGLTLGGVVHAQVIANGADDHFSGVDAHAHDEVETVFPADLVIQIAQRFAQPQGRITGALGMVFQRQRSAEQGHDPVAGVLIDRAFEPVHAFGEHLEKPIENSMPFFRVELTGNIQRAHHIGKQHADLFAFACYRGAGFQDPLRQVAGCVFRRRSGGRLCSSGRRSSLPLQHQDLIFLRGDLPDGHQFVDQIRQRLVIQIELPPQRPERNPFRRVEGVGGLFDDLEKRHRRRFPGRMLSIFLPFQPDGRMPGFGGQ